MRQVSRILFSAALILESHSASAQVPIEQAMTSIVSVLPVWSKGTGNLEEPEGSGIVIDTGNKILTTAHVLNSAGSVKIRTIDGEYISAEILWQDKQTDVALLEISKKLPSATLYSTPNSGLNTSPRPGERLCAIGNAFGLGISLSCGVASATGKTGVGFNPIEDFIQTDAAVNPGKSGGALVDANGRVVGMLSAIFTKQSDANIGINFAVSTRLLKALLKLKSASITATWRKSPLLLKTWPDRGKTGISGAQIVAFSENLNAEKTGLRIGDIIIRSGLRRIRSPTDFKTEFVIHEYDSMTITFLRNNVEMQFDWHFKINGAENER
jgi:S1-C subfamily serine protease